VAIAGTSWADLTPSRTVRSYRHANSGQVRTILVMNGGTSDYLNGATGSATYGVIKTYAQGATAAGYDRIIVCTTTPSTSVTDGFSPAQNVQRKAGNDLLIGNADAAFDAVVDLASDSSLSSPGSPHSGTTWYGTGNLIDTTNTTYYTDGLHWTAAGCADAASSINPALASFGVV
jgi:hypothetical protein